MPHDASFGRWGWSALFRNGKRSTVNSRRPSYERRNESEAQQNAGDCIPRHPSGAVAATPTVRGSDSRSQPIAGCAAPSVATQIHGRAGVRETERRTGLVHLPPQKGSPPEACVKGCGEASTARPASCPARRARALEALARPRSDRGSCSRCSVRRGPRRRSAQSPRCAARANR